MADVSGLDVGLVEAVVFRVPLVVSFVVLGLELVLPYVELVDAGDCALLVDEYVESVLEGEL